jgi:hypothetical protein
MQVTTQEFKCPYSGVALGDRSCTVASCSYNLNDNPAANVYNRCFLNYTAEVRIRANLIKGEFDFNNFSQEKKNKVAAQFFDISPGEVEKVNSEFYISLFSVFAEDVSVALRKHQLDPVPFKQCCVCGSESDELFIPKGGILPKGFGYCSYGCFQMKPPPILLIEHNMDLDFLEFIEAMEHQSHQGRAKFVRQLVEWVLGNSAMRL